MNWINKLKNIPYGVYDGLSVISSLISIITAIFACIKAVISIQKIDGHYEINLNQLFLWGIILALSLSVVLLIKFLKYAKLVRCLKKTFSYNYYNALHDLRNVYFDILKAHKLERGINAETKIERLTQDTKVFLVDLLDYLCDILESLTGKEVHGCVKLIENTQDKDKNINLMSATVRTFCRSKNTQPERLSNDTNNKESKRIIENSDFYDILDPNNNSSNSYFYQSNLLEYSKNLRNNGKKYKNTTDGWEDFYRSAIVAPIRAANEHLFFNKFNEGYHVVGFLCVDSMSTDAFRNTDSEKRVYSYIVKSFAAETYIILNMYSYYLQMLKGEVEND